MFATVGTVTIMGLTAIVSENIRLVGNRDIFDTEKKFNTLIETNGDNISIVFVDNYYDNYGSTVQIRTRDGLEVLTSLKNAQLMDVTDYSQAYNYAYRWAEENAENIICYDEEQDLSLDIEDIGYKKYLRKSYTFRYAIVLEEDKAVLYEVDSYRKWTDDKIQFITTDGSVLLKSVDSVKLVSIENADLDSLYKYAASLVGGSDNILDSTIKVYQKQI